MNFRDRILEQLAQRDYVPASTEALGKQWRLNTKERRKFAHEVGELVRTGRLILVKGDRLCLPKTADLVTGRINFRQSGSAVVYPEARATEPRKEPIQIAAENTGVALHGDQVVVELLTTRERQQYRFLKPGEQAGRVVKILERGSATTTGTLHRGRTYVYVTADDPRFGHDVIVPDPFQAKLRPLPVVGDKVVVRLNEWKERGRAPDGEIVEKLGRTFEPRAELAAIFHKYNLSTSFPTDVLREAEALPTKVRPSDLTGRLDYREIPTFTIDPDDAKDFDDALSLEHLDNGDLRIGVHIADVS
ncbi:MAG TPA: RNB domain-containing ribonuclease, partial [Candidatus Didemnitutus sp.]|nr:RNB domain-containing ribonuclease [Candidatus Didemnitutus sp.]